LVGFFQRRGLFLIETLAPATASSAIYLIFCDLWGLDA
jgi:hypothetical protein